MCKIYSWKKLHFFNFPRTRDEVAKIQKPPPQWPFFILLLILEYTSADPRNKLIWNNRGKFWQKNPFEIFPRNSMENPWRVTAGINQQFLRARNSSITSFRIFLWIYLEVSSRIPLCNLTVFFSVILRNSPDLLLDFILDSSKNVSEIPLGNLA